MNRDPVLLVDEFLRSDEPRLRRNGVVALGAITGPACTERLIEVALNDPDASVREAAENELAGLLRGDDGDLVTAYAKAEEQPERRSRIYALAGRLCAKGAVIKTFRAGIRSELALFFAAYPSRGWKFYFRALPAALGGGLVLLVILQIVFGIVANSGGLAQGVSSELITMAVLGYVFGVVIAVVASLFTTAYGFRISPRLGLAVEILFATIPPFVLYALVAVLLVLLMGSVEMAFVSLLGIVVVAMVASARAFTILAVGAGSSRPTRLLRATVAGSTGAILVTTAVILVTIQDGMMQSYFWAWAVPASGALAAAFAAIDARERVVVSNRAFRTVTSVLLVVAAAVPFIVLASFYIGRRSAATALSQLPIGKTVDSTTRAQSVVIPSVPYRIRVNVDERWILFARAYNPDRLLLSDIHGKTVAEEAFSLTHEINAGAHDLYYLARSSDELTTADALPKTLRMFVRPFSPRSWRSSRAPAREQLNPPRVLSLAFRVPDVIDEGSAPGEFYSATDTVATSMVATPMPVTASSESISAAERRAIERVASIDEHARSGRIDLALADVREARKLYPNVSIDWATWNQLCWHAAIRNDAAAVVNEACEYAAALAPNDPSVRDSRGVARARTGNYAGAIEDFNFYVSHTTSDARRLQRAKWIKTLQEGKDPFTPTELKPLATE